MPCRGDGEGEVGQVEDGDFTDAQGHVAGDTAFAVVIKHKGTGAQMPGGVQTGTGCPGDVVEVVAVVFAVEAGVLCRADGGLLFAPDVVFGFFKAGGFGFAVVATLVAFDGDLAVRKDTAALEFGLAVFVPVGEFGCEEVFVTLLHFHRAVELGEGVVAFGIVGVDVHLFVIGITAQFGKDGQRISDTLQGVCRKKRQQEDEQAEDSGGQHARPLIINV